MVSCSKLRVYGSFSRGMDRKRCSSLSLAPSFYRPLSLSLFFYNFLFSFAARQIASRSMNFLERSCDCLLMLSFFLFLRPFLFSSTYNIRHSWEAPTKSHTSYLSVSYRNYGLCRGAIANSRKVFSESHVVCARVKIRTSHDLVTDK